MSLAGISLVKLGIGIVWILSPAILIVLAIRESRKADRAEPREKVMPIAVSIAALADWVSFLFLAVLGFIGGFGTHIVTTPTANWFVVGSLVLLVVAVATKIARGKLALASLLILGLWVGSEMVA